MLRGTFPAGRYRGGMIRVAAGAVLVVAMLAGCTGGDDGGQAAPPATTAAPSATDSGSATPSASPSPTLPEGCEVMLPFSDLDEALGRPLFGQSRYTKGVAQPSIGRTARITCAYGLQPQSRGVAPIEVGISDYTDAEAAGKRVQATISAERSAGSNQSEATVGGVPATILGGRTVVTLVLAQGSRTVAVTLQRNIAGSLGQGVTYAQAITGVAEKVLTNLAT